MGHFLLVGDGDSQDVEEVSQHGLLHGDIQLRVAVQTGRDVHLQNPGSQVLVEDDVEPEQLVARLAILHVGPGQPTHTVLRSTTKPQLFSAVFPFPSPSKFFEEN